MGDDLAVFRPEADAIARDLAGDRQLHDERRFGAGRKTREVEWRAAARNRPAAGVKRDGRRHHARQGCAVARVLEQALE